jgi:hypothetical protein
MSANYVGPYANESGPVTAPKQPEVSSEMERLMAQCETIEKQISQLETRLATVLAQRAETGQADAKVPEPVRVPLAQAIHGRVKHLSDLSDQLQSIINRIEV